MRPILLLLPALLSSCVDTVSRREILERSRAEVALRDPWMTRPYIEVDRSPDTWRLTWKVTAGSMDHSDYPDFRGIRLVPGSEREMLFTRDGCLIEYSGRTGRCLPPSDPGLPPEEWLMQEK